MAKKENTAAAPKPWEGIMTKANYDKVTSDLTKKQKEDFDIGLTIRDVDLLMGLRAQGLYNPTRNRASARGKNNGAKK